MPKYDHTSIPMAESLAKLNVFLSRYSNYIQIHVPPTYFPQENLIVCSLKLRYSDEEKYDDAPLLLFKMPLLEEPEDLHLAQRNYQKVRINENDVYTRRWQTHIEHLLTFVLESPDGIKREAAYRSLGGYLATKGGENLLETMRPQLAKAMETGRLPAKLNLFRTALPAGTPE